MSNISYTTNYSPEQCEEILNKLDQELEEHEKRIRFSTKEHWHMKRFVSRITGFLWAKQVTQSEEDNVCDSPFIQVLERRATADLAQQNLDYNHLIDDVKHILEICEDRLAALKPELANNMSHANSAINVDLGNTAGMNEQSQAQIAEHDKAIIAAQRQAQVAATQNRISSWQGVHKHAVATLATAVSDKIQAQTIVRCNYSEQGQTHLKWALEKKGLESPFILPGALAGVPVLDTEEEVLTCSD